MRLFDHLCLDAHTHPPATAQVRACAHTPTPYLPCPLFPPGADTTTVSQVETPPVTNVSGTVNITIPATDTPFNLTLQTVNGSCPTIICPTWVSTSQTILCAIVCDPTVTSVTPTLLVGVSEIQQLPVAVAFQNISVGPTQCVTVTSPTLTNLTSAATGRNKWANAPICASNTTGNTTIKTIVTPPGNDFNGSCTQCEANYTLVTPVYVYDSAGNILDASSTNISKPCSGVLTCGALTGASALHGGRDRCTGNAGLVYALWQTGVAGLLAGGRTAA